MLKPHYLAGTLLEGMTSDCRVVQREPILQCEWPAAIYEELFPAPQLREDESPQTIV